MKTSEWARCWLGWGSRNGNRSVRLPLLLLGFIAGFAFRAECARYDFIAEESSLSVWVPRAGMLSFVGHDHTIEAESFNGFLEWEPNRPEIATLAVEVPVKTLRVVEEKDRAEVLAKMRSGAVLDQNAYPWIRFESKDIVVEEPGRWIVTGTLTVRGIQRTLGFPAEVTFPTDDAFIATGSAELRPENFGIEPITALAGTVRTADVIEVRFTIRGRRNGK